MSVKVKIGNAVNDMKYIENRLESRKGRIQNKCKTRGEGKGRRGTGTDKDTRGGPLGTSSQIDALILIIKWQAAAAMRHQIHCESSEENDYQFNGLQCSSGPHCPLCVCVCVCGCGSCRNQITTWRGVVGSHKPQLT